MSAKVNLVDTRKYAHICMSMAEIFYAFLVECADERDETDRRCSPTTSLSVAVEAAKSALAAEDPMKAKLEHLSSVETASWICERGAERFANKFTGSSSLIFTTLKPL
jgi:hypothetical protein